MEEALLTLRILVGRKSRRFYHLVRGRIIANWPCVWIPMVEAEGIAGTLYCGGLPAYCNPVFFAEVNARLRLKK
jgi:hypothetical protein